MRRRKKTIAAALLVLAGVAALVFWPRDHPHARQAFAAVRELVEVQSEASSAALREAGDDNNTQIEIQIVIAKLNLTDARTRLFAESVPSDKLIVARVASPQSVLEILQPLDVTSIEAQPRVFTLCGQLANVISGGEVPIAPIVVGAPVTYQSVGTRVGVQANVTRSNTVTLKFECELSHIAGVRTVATPQGPVDQPDVKSIRASAWAELKNGEALFLGGLTQRSPATVIVKTPYLGELPGIGSWFHFRRQREIEEELVVLVTPRIIDPVVTRQTPAKQ